jgi:hypothetical protein
MTSCVNPNDCITGAQGVTTPNPWEILSPILNQGEPLVHIVKDYFKWLGRLLFDVVYRTQDGIVYMDLTFKGGVGAGRDFTLVRTNADCQIEWREMVICRAQTRVANSVSGSNTIEVTDIADLRGIKAGTRIHIATPTGVISADVEDVTNNTLTLANGQEVTATAGDVVVRGAYNRDWDCQADIDNRFTVRQPKTYKSNFRKINITHKFRTCDLSLDRYTITNGLNGTQQYVNSLKSAGNEGFMNDFQDAIYMDRNLPVGNSVNLNGGAETMGLIPAIQKAQADTGLALIKDYSLCCADADDKIEATRASIKAFLRTIMDAHQSGLYEDGTVTVVANNEQLRLLVEMQTEMSTYFNLTIYTDESVQDGLNLGAGLPKIKYGGVTVDFMYEPYFDTLFRFPFHLILPPKHMAAFQREYQGIQGPNLELVSTINSQISGGTPTLQFVDRTDFETNGMGDCYVFQAEFEFATAFAGADKWGYFIGINFGSCLDACQVCGDEVPAVTVFSDITTESEDEEEEGDRE